MSEIKSLADQLRSSIAGDSKKDTDGKPDQPAKRPISETNIDLNPKILQLLLEYDTSGHKTMVHARFDARTAKMLGHFKMATGVENTRLAAFAVDYLFKMHPELKLIIKHYIQNLDL